MKAIFIFESEQELKDYISSSSQFSKSIATDNKTDETILTCIKCGARSIDAVLYFLNGYWICSRCQKEFFDIINPSAPGDPLPEPPIPEELHIEDKKPEVIPRPVKKHRSSFEKVVDDQVIKPEKVKEEKVPRICANSTCGATFTPYTRRQVYCSKSCFKQDYFRTYKSPADRKKNEKPNDAFHQKLERLRAENPAPTERPVITRDL